MGHQNSDKELNKKSYKKKMKLAVAATVAVASAQDKKVPPRHPLSRLNKLEIFANEWLVANTDAKVAAHWEKKFERNVDRFEARFDQCGFYDKNQLPHGGPKPDRRRRDADDDLSWLDDNCEGKLCERYDKNNPIRGLQQIMRGFQRWAERYIQTSTRKTSNPIKSMERHSYGKNEH